MMLNVGQMALRLSHSRGVLRGIGTIVIVGHRQVLTNGELVGFRVGDCLQRTRPRAKQPGAALLGKIGHLVDVHHRARHRYPVHLGRIKSRRRSLTPPLGSSRIGDLRNIRARRMIQAATGSPPTNGILRQLVSGLIERFDTRASQRPSHNYTTFTDATA
jgi:hypothetical protein